MQSIHLLTPHDTDDTKLEAILHMPVVDYRCHRLLYTTENGRRALGTIIRDALGHLTVRRVTPGRLEVSQGLQNWLEISVFLDMAFPNSKWMRDLEEEERLRREDRNQLER